MWYPASIVTPASAEPVSAAEVKEQAIIDSADDDATVTHLISAARSHVEAYCGIRLAEQIVAIRCDRFTDFERLPEAPAQDIESITYIDPAGSEQTLSETAYQLHDDGLEPSIALKPGQVWPAIQPRSRITVTLLVGYEDLPAAIKHAMLMWIAGNYAKRENGSLENWTAFDALLCNYRRGV